MSDKGLRAIAIVSVSVVCLAALGVVAKTYSSTTVTNNPSSSSFTIKGRAVTVLSETVHQRGNPLKSTDTLAIRVRQSRGSIPRNETYLIDCKATDGNVALCQPQSWLGNTCTRNVHHWSTDVDNTLPNPSYQPYVVGAMYYCVSPAVGQCVEARVHLTPQSPGLAIQSYRAATGCR